MSRDLYQVIERMVDEIPEDQEWLLNRLASHKTSVSYCPPESMGFWWNEVANSLADAIPEPKLWWELRVAEIFNGKPLDLPEKV